MSTEIPKDSKKLIDKTMGDMKKLDYVFMGTVDVEDHGDRLFFMQTEIAMKLGKPLVFLLPKGGPDLMDMNVPKEALQDYSNKRVVRHNGTKEGVANVMYVVSCKLQAGENFPTEIL